jgi:hypothetical protein
MEIGKTVLLIEEWGGLNFIISNPLLHFPGNHSESPSRSVSSDHF